MQKKKIILIIGGHDPTGGAGITADIETANHFNCHPLSILTCTTIQDTSGVTKISNMPKDYIYKCFDKLINEFKVNVIKIGLIPSLTASKEILKILSNKKIKNIPIIIDPIIKSGSGTELVTKNNLNYVIKNIYPKSDLLTPNIYEYNIIKKLFNIDNNINNILVTNYSVKNNEIVLNLKPSNYQKEKNFSIKKFKKKFHGTGCTFSTAIACNISKNISIEKSIKISLLYMKESIINSSVNGKKQSFLSRNLL
tara:strand:- start:5860 stop:6618 length:759 start_codon:yes stop_codon:yes gene_type:complete